MIELLIFNSLIIWGVFTSLQEGMIYEWFGMLIRGRYEEVVINRVVVKKPIGFHLP